MMSHAELAAEFAVRRDNLKRAKQTGRKELLGILAGAAVGVVAMAVMVYFGAAELAALTLGVVGGAVFPGISLMILVGNAASRAKKRSAAQMDNLRTVFRQRRGEGAASFAPFLPLSPRASAAYARDMKKLTEEFYVRSAIELRQATKVGKPIRFRPPSSTP